jgi:hypothetical protein
VVSGVKNAWSANVAGTHEITPIVIGSGIDELSNNTLTMEKREDIATALGVPHSLVLSNAANFATAEADRLNFYETTILPEATLIAESLNRQLFHPLGLNFTFKPSEMSIYQEDEEQRAVAFKTYVDAGILPSIVAQMLGLNLPEGITPEMLDPIQEPTPPIILPAAPPAPLPQLTGPVAGEGDEYADEVRKGFTYSDEDAEYAAVFEINLDEIAPMVATPGDPRNGIPIDQLTEDVKIDAAYGGSCTGGKMADMDMYAEVLENALAAGKRVAEGVHLYIQFGSQRIKQYARERGYIEIFERAGAELIDPSCGACINAGPGASPSAETVTVSAQNRNFPGRSGPGKLYLASPYVVAASAIAGKIVAFEKDRQIAQVEIA